MVGRPPLDSTVICASGVPPTRYFHSNSPVAAPQAPQIDRLSRLRHHEWIGAET